jgi:hypothetical protein
MDAERWKRVDELLQAALRVPAERQKEFLRQQCGADSELLEEVRSLLTSDRKAGSFLESPGLHVADVAAQLPTLGVSASGHPTMACSGRWGRAAWGWSTRRRTLLSGDWSPSSSFPKIRRASQCRCLNPGRLLSKN